MILQREEEVQKKGLKAKGLKKQNNNKTKVTKEKGYLRDVFAARANGSLCHGEDDLALNNVETGELVGTPETGMNNLEAQNERIKISRQVSLNTRLAPFSSACLRSI